MERLITSRQLRLRAILQSELFRRCDRNPRYSLRAFAKALGISHTYLSLILSGKRPISKKAQKKIASILEINLDERTVSPTTENLDNPLFDHVVLDHQAFRSEWHHSAILCLLETRHATVRPKSIARLLGIQEIQARAALDRLRRLGLISNRAGKWTRDRMSKSLEEIIPHKAPRKLHQNLIEKAGHAIENTDERKRSFAASIVALNPVLLAALTELILEFQKTFQEKAASARTPSEVYALSVHLFPLSKDESGNG